MAKYVNAKQLARRFMSKGKDKMRLSTIINEIEIAEKGLSLEIDAVEVVRCKDCGVKGAAFCMAGDAPLTETTGEYFCSYGEKKDDE